MRMSLCAFVCVLGMLSDHQAMAQVTSITGDGTIISNSASTGAVTLTLEHPAADTLLGNPTGSAAAPIYTTAPTVSGEMTADDFNATSGGNAYGIGGVATLFYPDGDTSSIGVGEYAALNQNGTSLYNTAVGSGALIGESGDKLTGNYNTAIGSGSLSSIEGAASDNTAVGFQADYDITAGSYNTIVGYAALYRNLTGSDSTAIGTQALFYATSSPNDALGYNAGVNITTGANNVAIGYAAMQGTSGGSGQLTGSDNTAVGNAAAYNLQGTAANNTAIGYEALFNETETNNNTAVGYAAGSAITTGTPNTVVGYEAGLALTTSTNNVLIGDSAGAALTTTGNGNGSTAVGSSALVAATKGPNTAVGYQALYTDTSGVYNTAVGYQALQYVQPVLGLDGSGNTGVGYQAMQGTSANPMTGVDNTAIGYAAGLALQDADDNTLVGEGAGDHLATGGGNTLIGEGAGYEITSGGNNVVVGTDAGILTGGSKFNIVIDGQTPAQLTTGNFQIDIADTLYGTQSSTGTMTFAGGLALPGIANSNSGHYLCWNTSTNAVEQSSTACSSSLRRMKQDITPVTGALAEVLQLQPMEYRFRPETGDGNRLQIGLIAEDVAALDPRFAAYDGKGALTGVDYEHIAVLDAAAIQEMQKEINSLKAELKTIREIRAN